jgi:hypothetical protein
MSGKVLPVDFGSTEESAQLMTLVPSLEGVAGAASAQVAVLAILYARHVQKSGRKPVLAEAVSVLTQPESAPEGVLQAMELDLQDAEVTRATRAFVLGSCKALSLETRESLRQAFDNAAAALIREHTRRSAEVPETATEPPL